MRGGGCEGEQRRKLSRPSIFKEEGSGREKVRLTKLRDPDGEEGGDVLRKAGIKEEAGANFSKGEHTFRTSQVGGLLRVKRSQIL